MERSFLDVRTASESYWDRISEINYRGELDPGNIIHVKDFCEEMWDGACKAQTAEACAEVIDTLDSIQRSVCKASGCSSIVYISTLDFLKRMFVKAGYIEEIPGEPYRMDDDLPF